MLISLDIGLNTLQILIHLCLRTKSLMIQPKLQIVLQQTIDHRKQRHSDDHADNAPHSAEQQDCKKYPECGQTGRFTKNSRSYYVSVQLLQNNDKNHKI